MLAVALIVFRESLEAALLIGILVAATRGLDGRGRWLAGGAAAGAVGAVGIALAVTQFPQLIDGTNQEIFNASVLGAAVLMLAWHQVWMSQHGAELAADARQVASAVRSGERSLAAVGVVAAIAVLREGSETVLFLFGSMTGGQLGASDVILGSAFGLFLGVTLGVVVYAGLARIPLRQLFQWTGVLLVMVAAGMASQAAGFLIQADLIPSLASPLWDTSAFVANGSALGAALRALVGYEARPDGMQVAVFVVTLVAILTVARWVRLAPGSRRKTQAPAPLTS